MIHIPYDETKLQFAKEKHVDALISYIKGKDDAYRCQLYTDVTGVMQYGKSYSDVKSQDDWKWLKQFILADIGTLKSLTSYTDKLQFKQFEKIYKQYFSNGSDKYVDQMEKYNSYSFVENLGIKVCPYCDKEYLDVVKQQDGRTRRTLEVDHFIPKSVYPALAMCFYNLVPSGQGCNGLKSSQNIDKSPYEMDIESHTRLCPDLPIGVNMENVSVDECEIKFHAHKDMMRNIKVFALEERYNNKEQKELAYELLRKKQRYTDDKLAEMVRAGFVESIEVAKRDLFGELSNSQNSLFNKLKRDILGL